jgi:hypothetical protein
MVGLVHPGSLHSRVQQICTLRRKIVSANPLSVTGKMQQGARQRLPHALKIIPERKNQ